MGLAQAALILAGKTGGACEVKQDATTLARGPLRQAAQPQGGLVARHVFDNDDVGPLAP